jgi:hypothetical protein
MKKEAVRLGKPGNEQQLVQWIGKVLATAPQGAPYPFAKHDVRSSEVSIDVGLTVDSRRRWVKYFEDELLPLIDQPPVDARIIEKHAVSGLEFLPSIHQNDQVFTRPDALERLVGSGQNELLLQLRLKADAQASDAEALRRSRTKKEPAIH